MNRQKFAESRLWNVIIFLLGALLLLNIAMAVMSVGEELKGYPYEESSFLYAMESRDYARMLEMKHRNEGYRVKTTETMRECYAVAQYFEAAVYERAYREDGQTDKAEAYRKKKEEQREAMGAFSYAAEEIDVLAEKNVTAD